MVQEQLIEQLRLVVAQTSATLSFPLRFCISSRSHSSDFALKSLASSTRVTCCFALPFRRSRVCRSWPGRAAWFQLDVLASVLLDSDSLDEMTQVPSLGQLKIHLESAILVYGLTSLMSLADIGVPGQDLSGVMVAVPVWLRWWPELHFS